MKLMTEDKANAKKWGGLSPLAASVRGRLPMRQAMLILIILSVAGFSNVYRQHVYEQQIGEISKMRDSLSDARNYNIESHCELTSKQRLDYILDAVRTHDLGLVMPDTMPSRLNGNKQASSTNN